MTDAFIFKVVGEELESIPEVCKEKGPYICYILRSVVTPMRTYSGSTNNFIHRLKQHNGILAGGAVMTKTSRPWRVAALVYGFSSRSAALRYEWFTKMKHSKTWKIKARQGKNALQRRAALLMTADLKMKPVERSLLTYHVPDSYFRRCVEEAHDEGVPGTIDAIFAKVKNVLKEKPITNTQDEHTQGIVSGCCPSSNNSISCQERPGSCGRCDETLPDS